MSLLALLAAPGGGSTPPSGPWPDLPDLIEGGERIAPYTLPMAPVGYSPHRAPVAAITPTYDGSGAAVHPSVVDMVAETGAPFRGFRYWMAMTPYPDSDSTKENPSILVSNYGWEWQVPQGLTNPLDLPTTWYYSDPDLVWDHDASRFVLYYRNIGEGLHAQTSVDGVTWAKRGIISGDSGVSPSILRKGPHDWWLWSAGFDDTQLMRATSPLGPWTATHTGITIPDPGTYGDLWHYDVLWDAETERFFAVCVDRGWETFPAVSADGVTWTGGPRITDNTYRPTMVRSDNPDWYCVWGSLQIDPVWSLQYTQYPRSLWTDLIP